MKRSSNSTVTGSAPRGFGIEERALVQSVFAQYERYLPSPQDIHQYRRKCMEYLEEIAVKWNDISRGADNGRDDFDVGGTDD